MADEENCDEKTALKSGGNNATGAAADGGDRAAMEMSELHRSPAGAEAANSEPRRSVSGGPTAMSASPAAVAVSASKIPILFERSAQSWWNPRFDSNALESQHIANAFPLTRRRFRYAVGYVMLSCAAWCVFFGVYRQPKWPAFVAGTAALLVVSAAIAGFTFFAAYRRCVLPLSFALTSLLCVGNLLTFAFGDESVMSSVGTFAWSVEIVVLMYTLIPMPLYVCALAGAAYSVSFEVIAACFGETTGGRYIVGRALLHVCIHAVGVHIFVMSEVRERSTFLKVGQSLILRRALQTEKRLKHNMINSLMPPKVAEEVMQSRDPNNDENNVNKPTTSTTGPVNSRDMFRTFHMLQMDSVSILFADIVGFTKMSSGKPADKLVQLLNDLFGRFDDICQRNSCEKISTLGDCYYCVSGCPEPRPDHAKCCVEMGLAMCVAIQQFDRDHDVDVNMRVGVHTGAVLCGIVGTRRFKFDVWSHDVTIANMMESEGRPGRVHVSDDTKKHIVDLYNMEPGEDVEEWRGCFGRCDFVKAGRKN